jgi:hypothetical protein
MRRTSYGSSFTKEFEMRHAIIGLLCSSLLGLVGCSSKVASITVFSTRNVDMSYPHKRMEREKAEDGRLWLLFLPLGGTPSGLQAANEILESTDADYLTNVEVTEGGWSLLAISRGWVKVEADPWRKE